MLGIHVLTLIFMVSALFAQTVKYDTIDAAIASDDLSDVLLHIKLYPDCLDQGAHPSMSPLHQSILRKKPEIALALIKAGAEVDGLDGSFRTPLHLCVERGLLSVAKALLKAGANPNEWDKVGWTPLHNAAAKDRLTMAQVLIAGGANAKVLSKQGGTALHEAAVSASAEIVRLILTQGVDPNLVAKDGLSALDIAIAHGNQAATLILKKESE